MERVAPVEGTVKLVAPVERSLWTRFLAKCDRLGLKPAALFRLWLAGYLNGDDASLPAGYKAFAEAEIQHQRERGQLPEGDWTLGIRTRVTTEDRERFRLRASQDGLKTTTVARAWVESFTGRPEAPSKSKQPNEPQRLQGQ